MLRRPDGVVVVLSLDRGVRQERDRRRRGGHAVPSSGGAERRGAGER